LNAWPLKGAPPRPRKINGDRGLRSVIERLLDRRAEAKTEFLVVLDQNCDHTA
jgi:hypothetical protein